MDGEVAFTGGVNISDVYSEGSPSGYLGASAREPWRDTQVQIKGPAVAEFQNLFWDTWSRQNGPKLPPRNYFPTPKNEGDSLVGVVGSTPGKRIVPPT